MCFTSFLQSTSRKVVSGDTMMNQALGPVWHAKQKAQRLIPERLRGVDREATWGKRHADGWGYGQGSCCLVSHRPGVLGAFKDRRHSAHDATRVWLDTGQLRGVVETVLMDSKADAPALCTAFQRQRGMTRWTTPRNNRAHTAARQPMISVLNLPTNRRVRQQRGQPVEPRQGLGKDIVALEHCGRHGHRHHRWLLAAMGVTVQRPQARALKRQHAGWKITQELLGL
jgi:hypothetical protein